MDVNCPTGVKRLCRESHLRRVNCVAGQRVVEGFNNVCELSLPCVKGGGLQGQDGGIVGVNRHPLTAFSGAPLTQGEPYIP